MKMRSLKYQRGFIGNAFEGAIKGMLIAGIVFGVALGWVVWEGLPMFWQWVKPWLHQITA